MHQWQSANMISMGMSNKDGPYILPLKLGKIWQRVGLMIHAHPCIDNKPLFGQFDCNTTGTNATRTTQKDNLHLRTPSSRKSINNV